MWAGIRGSNLRASRAALELRSFVASLVWNSTDTVDL
jgi:hypothetical protein